jgi:hypothetical protein
MTTYQVISEVRERSGIAYLAFGGIIPRLISAYWNRRYSRMTIGDGMKAARAKTGVKNE